jgi:hypothetical protein
VLIHTLNNGSILLRVIYLYLASRCLYYLTSFDVSHLYERYISFSITQMWELDTGLVSGIHAVLTTANRIWFVTVFMLCWWMDRSAQNCIWIHNTYQSILECKLAVTWHTHSHIQNCQHWHQNIPKTCPFQFFIRHYVTEELLLRRLFPL